MGVLATIIIIYRALPGRQVKEMNFRLSRVFEYPPPSHKMRDALLLIVDSWLYTLFFAHAEPAVSLTGNRRNIICAEFWFRFRHAIGGQVGLPEQ